MIPRVVSLLPAATEIVCALGARAQLVGRSHECDYPADLSDLPVLSRSRVAATAPGAIIDAEVRQLLAAALAIYEVDLDGLAAAAPDVILTQDLCSVCAVSRAEVERALRQLAGHPVEVISLSPTRLEDLGDNLRSIALAIGCRDAGTALWASLTERLGALAARFATVAQRPGVVTIEWLDPPMIGGLWMPELIAIAGGTPLGCAIGAHAHALDDDDLAALDPEVVVVKPCGWPLAHTQQQAERVAARLPAHWPARRTGRIWLADGNAFFNRPGPRLVESAEILAACLHPEIAADLAARHRDWFARWG